MTLPTGQPLIGRWVRLSLLTGADLEEMYPILADPAIYEHGYVMHHRPITQADSRELARSRFLARQGQADGESIHLGSTVYGPRWWGTQVNPECKLLLAHCFQDCGYGRVKIQTDVLNARSRAAIEKLGARYEGLLRRHMRREDGTFRDTVVYSVLKDEWQVVKAGLIRRLP